MIKVLVAAAAALVLAGCIVIDEASHMADSNCHRMYGLARDTAEYQRCHTYERRRISAQLSAHDAILIDDFRRSAARFGAGGSGGVVAPVGSTIILPDGTVRHVPW